MYGYNDITYCASSNCQNKCGRKLTDEIRKEAEKEWELLTGSESGCLFSVSKFCEENPDAL